MKVFVVTASVQLEEDHYVDYVVLVTPSARRAAKYRKKGWSYNVTEMVMGKEAAAPNYMTGHEDEETEEDREAEADRYEDAYHEAEWINEQFDKGINPQYGANFSIEDAVAYIESLQKQFQFEDKPIGIAILTHLRDDSTTPLFLATAARAALEME